MINYKIELIVYNLFIILSILFVFYLPLKIYYSQTILYKDYISKIMTFLKYTIITLIICIFFIFIFI